jgi:hypothetical protein
LAAETFFVAARGLVPPPERLPDDFGDFWVFWVLFWAILASLSSWYRR